MAKGLDAGTAYLIAAHTENIIKKQHNAFLTLDGEAGGIKRQLGRLSIPFIELNQRIHIVGEHAFSYAQIFGSKDLRRPMKDGLLNPTEKDALPILKAIIKELLGTPKTPNETCVYSSPAAPIDSEELVDYHEDILGQIIESLGFKPLVIKEAVALAYHGLVDENLTGVSISMGAGMVNCAVLYAGMDAINFSIKRGGTWIDTHVSLDTGVPQAKVQFLKESGEINLGSPKITFEGGDAKIEEFIAKDNIQQAIRSYYEVLITYILTNIANQFSISESMPTFPEPVIIAIGGGTAMVPGFVELFKEQFDKMNFPIDIKEIRLVENTHEGVALGCLNEAILSEEQ